MATGLFFASVFGCLAAFLVGRLGRRSFEALEEKRNLFFEFLGYAEELENTAAYDEMFHNWRFMSTKNQRDRFEFTEQTFKRQCKRLVLPEFDNNQNGDMELFTSISSVAETTSNPTTLGTNSAPQK